MTADPARTAIPPASSAYARRRYVRRPARGNDPTGAGPPSPKRVSMLSLLRGTEFRILTITQFFSIAGDQLARVALTVLVFNRTNSALQAAIAYALSFIPAAIGGPLLSGLADRHPRRTVMISADLARVPLIGLMAIPALPLPISMALIAVAGLFEAPFDAARGALLPDVLIGDRYTAGYAFGQIVLQAAQVGGFGLAGVLLIGLSPSVLLGVDAVTFLLSAGLIARYIRSRPAADLAPDEAPAAWWTNAMRDARSAVRLVMRAPGLRSLVLLAWASSTFAISFEALGAPLARDSGAATWTVGVLLAAQPAGVVVGALLTARLPATARPRAMQVLAIFSMLPLVFGLLRPPVAVLVLLGFLSGVGTSFNVLASTAFVKRVAPEMRGRALGLVGTGLLVGQGVGVVVAGALASEVGARLAVGWLGTVGVLAVILALWDGTRARQMAAPD